MDQDNHHYSEQSAGSNADWLPHVAPGTLLPMVLARLGLTRTSSSLQSPLETIVTALSDPAWQVRAAAARTLGERQESTAVGSLVSVLHDPAWQVRTAAAQALGALGEHAPLELLVVASSDEDASVRAAAISALGRFGERAPLGPLLAALQDPEWLVREMAARVLGTLGKRVPIEPLVAAVNDENAFVCRAAALALVHTHLAPLSTASQVVQPLQQQSKHILPQLQFTFHAAITMLVTWSQVLFASKRHVPGEWQHKVLETTSRSAGVKARQQPAANRQLFPRLLAGGLAAMLVVMSLLFTWLPRTQHPIAPGNNSSAPQRGNVIFTYQGGQGVEGSPVWSPESKYLTFLSSFGYAVQVWDSAIGNLVQNPLEPVPYVGPHTASGWSWSADGRYLAVTSEDASSRDAAVQVWDAITGRNTLTVHSHASGVLYTAWSYDGTRIAFSGDDGMVQIWDPLTGQKLSTFAGHPGAGHRLFWSADDQLLLVSSPDGTFQLWNASSGTSISTFHDPASTLVALSPDGHRMVSRDDQGALHTWDSPDDQDTLRVWDTFSGRELATYQSPSGGVHLLEWSPEGRRILIANDSQVQIWDATTGQTLLAFPNPAVHSMGQPLSQGGWIFTANDSEVQIWDTITGHVLLDFPNPSSSRMWQISPDGQYFALGTWNNSVQVWNVVTGRKVSSFPGLTAHVQVLAWSPVSRRIAFASTDGTVQVWNAVTGSDIVTYRGLAHVVSLTWSPDGKFIAATSEDNTVHVLQAI